jgi:hypothetical protein
MKHKRALLLFVVAAAAVGISVAAQQRSYPEPAPPLYVLEDSYLSRPLLPEDQAYAQINGKRLKGYVTDQAAISRRYRDAGHQFWGRIIGTEADAESAQWLADRLRAAGAQDVRSQPFDLPPQWMPSSWSVSLSGGAASLTLESAQPAYLTVGTPAGGLDLEAVWLGTGTDADFAGRNVSGKAAVIFSSPLPGSWSHSAMVYDAMRRAERHGAAAVFTIIELPGNIKMQFYPTGNNVPSFALGRDDGERVREQIEKADAGRPPHLKVQLSVTMVPGLKTSSVWGVVPGTTDENVLVVAHRDGWFEGGTDNASGVATAIGLAEYYAKLPRQKRRRTLTIVGTPGHHNGAILGPQWIADHKDTQLAKTALIINCEHTASVQTYLLGPVIRKANTAEAFWWYVGGSTKLAHIAVQAYERFGVATFERPEARAAGEIGPIFALAPSIQLIQSDVFFHSDAETADTVPPAGLAATTRAYAKIIDDVNKLTIADLARASTGSTKE